MVFFLAAAASPPSASAQPAIPAMGHREAAWVASTPDFRFYSDFWLNLHGYLYGIAGGGPDERAGYDPEETACFGALPEEHAAGWQAAEAFYRAAMGERHHRSDPLMRTIRYTLTGLASDFSPEPQRLDVFKLLEGAAPGYHTCLWKTHDARNRRRIAELVGLLAIHGPALQAELSRHYQEPWPEPITVDVMNYSDNVGANTASGRYLPPHTMLSSVKGEMAGVNGLEMVLHEASHGIFGPRWGTITEHLVAASEAHGVRPPRNLWHAISFYTSGKAVAGALQDAEMGGFTPYAWRNAMFDGPYRGYLDPLERFWQPYLDGEVELAEAMANLVGAIVQAEE